MHGDKFWVSFKRPSNRGMGRTRKGLGLGGRGRLFNNAKGIPRVKGTGYGTRNRALKTLKKLRGKPRALQTQVAITMYYRAKHHKYQTQGMRNAMRVYGPFLRSLKRTKRSQKGGRPTWIQRTIPAYPAEWESRSYPLEADMLP